ncbi:unnamed protein product [Adineta steineri]|uniref:Uncharacterized protein n=2 Tax=Adineta steineri TaxID=433720 RepID=A0A818ZDC7_9BILA|nr:unnamed protein product [Adineta steineri]CAF3762132.1 unnamed protein product [Adineta steineri]
MTTPDAPKFGVKFPSRKERTVKLVTKCETREIQKRLEPPKPPRVRPPPKPKVPKKPKPRPATLAKPLKPTKPSGDARSRSNGRPTTSISSRRTAAIRPRTLQTTDLEKLARLTCSREFSLFHQFIKPELSKAYENQLAFLQTKLQHLKNEFVNKQAEHLNFEQIRDYYNQALTDHVRRNIKPDEYLTLANKLKDDTKQAIDKWLRKKEFKPQRQVPEYLQRRQECIRDRIKETMVEQKRQQQAAKETDIATKSSITVTSGKTVAKPATTTVVDDDDDDIMIID